MSHLVTREDDMLGVQVLIGIVILFLETNDYKPAAVVIGNAAKLAYRLGLHQADSPMHGSPREAEQRARVFWITYFFDRGLALRTRTPPSIMDEDIDIPLPPWEPRDGVGLTYMSGGNRHVNYLRPRIDLSNFQGKIFELLHSNRGSKIRGPEREQHIQHLQQLLNQWYDRIPPLFQIENVVSTQKACAVIRLTRLFHEYQSAVLNLHGVYHNQDAAWVQQLSTAAIIDGRDFSVVYSQLMASCHRDRPTPSTEGWNHCVVVSRACMKLFQTAFPTENIVWNCLCSLYAGMVVLLTNILFYPTHPLVTLDQYMCGKAVDFLVRIEVSVAKGDHSALRTATFNLLRQANAAIDGAGSDEVAASGPLGGGAQHTLMAPFQENVVHIPQSFEMSLASTQESLFEGGLRPGEFRVDMQSFDPDEMRTFGVPTTETITDLPDYSGYTGGA